MKNLLSKLRSQAGFTMIELLIVIAILGILAVAVLSAINPVEQINRGRDTGSRSDAEQLLSAIDRFNAFQGYYPWKDGAGDTTAHALETAPVLWGAEDAVVQNVTTCNVTDLLSGGNEAGTCIGADELKGTFFNRVVEDTNNNPLYIYNQGEQGDSTYVCFNPVSNAFKTEAENRCSSGLPDDIATGVAAGLCGDETITDRQGNVIDNAMICLP